MLTRSSSFICLRIRLEIREKSQSTPIKKERPAKITMQFSLKDQPLQTGRYVIIPYFFTFHDRVQENFMEKVFPNSSSLDSNFFNIPMKREGGYLQVNE